jgi:hypothetical protein
MLPEPPARKNEGVAEVLKSLTALALGAFMLVGSTLAESPVFGEGLTLEPIT